MDLDSWLSKIKQARSHREVFAILDEFRKLDWPDNECSKMSKLYMRILENLGPPTAADSEKAASDSDSASAAAEKSKSAVAVADPAQTVPAPVNDGPVWYEKM